MSKFKLTEDKIGYICSQLGIADLADVSLAKRMYRDFLRFYDDTVRTQYLTTIVKAMERYIHEKYSLKNFKIIIRPMKKCNAKSGAATLKQNEHRYWITIPADADSSTQRNIVAHELGHLFFVMSCLYDKEMEGQADDKFLSDKMADAIGIFTILERTDFYKDKAPSVCPHDNWVQVVNDFKKLGIGRHQLKDPLAGTAREGNS